MFKARATLFALISAATLGLGAQNTVNTGRPAIPLFVERGEQAGLQIRFDGQDEFMVGGGVAAFDCDGDGLPELYVTGGVNKSKFYRNKSMRGGDVKLLEERSGLELTNAVGAYPLDIDGDGNTDLVVLRVGEVAVFKGLGGCKFEPANEAWGIKTGNLWHTAFSATWERGQSWPTLAFGTYYDRSKPEFPWGTCTAGLLLRPKIDGGYKDATPLKPGHCALSMLFSDWGRTGEAALRVSNDREYYQGGQEQLWQLAPAKPPALYTAAQGWKPLQIWGMGIASHDVLGEGYPQVFLTSMSDNKLQTLGADKSKPIYGDIAYKRGVTAHRPYVGGDVHPSTAWHAQFADVNHDGRADLFVVKGNVSTMPDFATLDPNNLLLQQPDGTFFEAGQLAGVASFKRGRGGLLVDLNGDGLLDMLVVNRWDKAQLWRNMGAGTADAAKPMGHWLQLRLSQAPGNRDAVGAWVEIDLGAGRVIRQEHTVGGGHASGHSGWLHFGLGEATAVKVRVQWPHSANLAWSEWMTVNADGFYTLRRDGDKSVATPWKAP